MPQVIARYSHALFDNEQLEVLGRHIRVLVARVASTATMPLTGDDVDWLPQVNELGAIAPHFALEITTIGYPQRKEAMGRERILELKRDILKLDSKFPVGPDDPLIWVKFTDPDDVHV